MAETNVLLLKNQLLGAMTAIRCCSLVKKDFSKSSILYGAYHSARVDRLPEGLVYGQYGPDIPLFTLMPKIIGRQIHVLEAYKCGPNLYKVFKFASQIRYLVENFNLILILWHSCGLFSCSSGKKTFSLDY